MSDPSAPFPFFDPNDPPDWMDLAYNFDDVSEYAAYEYHSTSSLENVDSGPARTSTTLTNTAAAQSEASASAGHALTSPAGPSANRTRNGDTPSSSHHSRDSAGHRYSPHESCHRSGGSTRHHTLGRSTRHSQNLAGATSSSAQVSSSVRDKTIPFVLSKHDRTALLKIFNCFNSARDDFEMSRHDISPSTSRSIRNGIRYLVYEGRAFSRLGSQDFRNESSPQLPSRDDLNLQLKLSLQDHTNPHKALARTMAGLSEEHQNLIDATLVVSCLLDRIDNGDMSKYWRPNFNDQSYGDEIILSPYERDAIGRIDLGLRFHRWEEPERTQDLQGLTDLLGSQGACGHKPSRRFRPRALQNTPYSLQTSLPDRAAVYRMVLSTRGSPVEISQEAADVYNGIYEAAYTASAGAQNMSETEDRGEGTAERPIIIDSNPDSP
ncbi:hypothetical protein IAR55_004936 [Kwoniella newhampshirensis]|uniref:Uncharacterized protein n=1 Tax=Kwoniella newhampshirensis TaxID=1651941 RepID=A0AAW0YJK5_9TREE